MVLMIWAVCCFSQAAPLTFNRDIRPILSEYCFACHGPDSNAREGRLRLDRGEQAVEDGVIVPGNAAGSKLMKRVASTDPEERMPPPKAHKTLSPAQRETLGRWIDEGADFEEHWAFIAPERPALPETRESHAWARNPIDHFVHAGLKTAGMKPNPEANRFTLARRVALDATGLPPVPELLAEYLGSESPEAYSRLVGRLLASRQAGEHRARYWLDAARYGDTHGMHLDNYREIWPYRDWVINAFNRNQPFDQFVVEQLAGDLLPQASLDQRIATGFSRCNVTTAEGGSIPEEVRVRYMVDRVETFGTVFLGLTMGCAVCHDHKYDPITMRDFYSLGAFFNNTTQPAMDGNRKDSPPVEVLPGEEFKAEWKQLQATRLGLRERLEKRKPDPIRFWQTRQPPFVHPVSSEQLVLHLPLTTEGSVGLPEEGQWETNHPAGHRGMRFGKKGTEVDLGAIRTDEPLTISFWIRSPNRLMNSTVMEHLTTLPDPKDPKKKRNAGWRIVSSVQGALTFSIEDGLGGKIDGLLPGDEALTPRAWQHVCIRYSGGQAKTSISILVNGKQGTPRPASEAFVEGVELPASKLKLGSNLPTGGLSDLRVFKRWLSDEEANLLAEEFVTTALLASGKTWADLSKAERQLATRYVENVADGKGLRLNRKLADSERRVDFIASRSTTTLVMKEQTGTKPKAWILNRGEYDQRRDEVGADIPAVLPALDRKAPRNRLGLAQWLTSRGHPLTARVYVNRLWQSVFGTGLVKTAEDFGVMGEAPSHPELLDWLAVEFVESGWDVRHLLRLILTSATYRQSGHISEEKYRRDPENRLLARGPRLRLDAETLRDEALAVSGLLRGDVGGPSVKPYQPEGLWRVVAFAGSNTKDFKQDSGDALYRRSVYTFWKRTSPPPSMAAFDAPTREQCTVRRERTNTPLQALATMNDPQYVEAARHLAQRTMLTRESDRERALWMYEAVLIKPAAPADESEMLGAVKDFRKIFSLNEGEAQKLISIGESKADDDLAPAELAAWTMLANLLLNRDDFINKN
jgi:hypothetical protein